MKAAIKIITVVVGLAITPQAQASAVTLSSSEAIANPFSNPVFAFYQAGYESARRERAGLEIDAKAAFENSFVLFGMFFERGEFTVAFYFLGRAHGFVVDL